MSVYIRVVGALAPLVVVLAGCASGGVPQTEGPPSVSPTPHSQLPSPTASADQGSAGLVSDGSGAVSADLVRLAHDVVAYVGGTRDSVPHTGEIELRIGGARVGTATLPTGPSGPRTLNVACPHGQSTYAAAVCPVDLFGPIKNARINNVGLTYAPDVAPILCAPPREGPPPRGSVIVLRPVEAWRTCASDFELVLMSDGHGRLAGIDLTLSEP